MDATRLEKALELVTEEAEYMDTGSDAQDGEFSGQILAVSYILENLIKDYKKVP